MRHHVTTKLLGFGCIALIAIYLMAFLNVPIVHDEASYRRHIARGLLDGFVQFAVFPDCKTPSPDVALFIPAHAFLSMLDGWFGWAGGRLIPVLSVMSVVVATALLARAISPSRWGLSAMVIAGGFVGVAGSGLVLSRFEFIANFQVSLIILTWLVGRNPSSFAVRWLTLTAHLAMLYLSLFVHRQGLILVPLSLLTSVYLLRTNIVAAWIVSAIIVTFSLASIPHQSFSCPEDPALAALVEKTQGVVFSNELEDYDWPSKLVYRALHYVQQFPFFSQDAFSIPIPPVDETTKALASVPIQFVVSSNLLILIAATIAAFGTLAIWHVPKLYRGEFRELARAMLDGRSVWAAAALGLLLYSAYDFGGTYYRAHFRNFLTVTLLAIGIAALRNKRLRRPLGAAASVSVLTCFGSAVIAWMFVAPQLAQGYEAYFVSRVRDWSVYDRQVRAVADRCGINPSDEHVVSDMATYQAMSRHRFPIDFNYVWYREYLEGKQLSRTPDQWREYYRRYSNSGAVVMCRSLSSAPMSVDVREGDICCVKF